MNKTFLIFRHEFIHTVKRTGFIVMTLIAPLLALLGIGVFYIVSGVDKPHAAETSKIGYVDEAGGFTGGAEQGNILLVRYENTGDATKALVKGDITDYFVIPSDYVSSGRIVNYTLKKQMNPQGAETAAVVNLLQDGLMGGKVPKEVADRIKAPMALTTVILDKTGAPAQDQGGLGNFIIPAVFSLLFALSMMFSAAYMLQGLGGEKENRLIEILLSSVSPRQLLAGKVLGLGAAGLAQVAVWMASLPLLLSLASRIIGGFAGSIRLPAGFLILDVLYFILGYLLFAVLAAGVGAISSTVQEGQQLSSLYSIFAIVPLWTMSLLIMFPDSPVWAVLSIFPLTAPVEVMVRLGTTNVPVWQLVAGIVLLVLCIIGGLVLSAKIFRVYLLMYGKRPKLKELISSIKMN